MKLLVLCNFYGNTVSFQFPEEFLGEKELLIANYSNIIEEQQLRPYEARMYQVCY